MVTLWRLTILLSGAKITILFVMLIRLKNLPLLFGETKIINFLFLSAMKKLSKFLVVNFRDNCDF